MAPEKKLQEWEVSGKVPTTATPTAEGLRVVWDRGESWRLRHLGQGNSPWDLPGKKIPFDHAKIKESTRASRAVIVVGPPHGGLTSLYHWLAGTQSGVQSLIVDLRDAELSGDTTSKRMQAIAQSLQTEVKLHYPNSEPGQAPTPEEPIQLIRQIAKDEEIAQEATLVFRGFEALDEESASRLYGRLRSLLESPRNELGRLGLVLIGQSVESLDPLLEKPVSTLLSMADIYTPAELEKDQVRAMAAKLALELDEAQIQQFMSWTGGEPLLVQALLQRLWSGADEPCETVEEAIEYLEYERLPGFDNWTRILTRQMREKPGTARIISQLLREDSYREQPGDKRFTLAELYIENWIYPGRDRIWEWRSKCRRMVAADAHDLRRLG